MKTSLLSLFLLIASVVSAQQPAPVSTNDYPCNPKTLPVLWHQSAAEYRALCYQAFNFATLRINEIPESELGKGNLAIITDIDETILDNSPGEAQSILSNETHFGPVWKEWVGRYEAAALPGAVGFLRNVHAKGISVFYLSNRDTQEVMSTIKNLRLLDLPDADPEHLLFQAGTSSKEARRQRILQSHQVVMLLGDNLNDFLAVFEKKGIPERREETDRVKEEWGRKFIVLPNAIYGEWENALYDYRRKLSPEQKDSLRVGQLKGYK